MTPLSDARIKEIIASVEANMAAEDEQTQREIMSGERCQMCERLFVLIKRCSMCGKAR